MAKKKKYGVAQYGCLGGTAKFFVGDKETRDSYLKRCRRAGLKVLPIEK